MNSDPGQYRPLTPQEILTYFQEVKIKIESIEKLLMLVIRLNDLKHQDEPKNRGQQKERTVAKKPMRHDRDEEAEDKALINKAIAKHDAKEHPGATPTKIKKGGHAARKPAARKSTRGR